MTSRTPSFILPVHCLWAGVSLMCFALLLHPMSPGDFLTQALTQPQAIWQSPYGTQAAFLFWLSMVPVLAGIAGLIRRAA